MRKIKGIFIYLMILIISLTSTVGFAEGDIEFTDYREAYYKKLIEFKNNDDQEEDGELIGKDGALVSHFNGEIPALFTISYYKGSSGNNDVYNYKYRVYIYEDGQVNLVRLGQNVIDNDADYNFYLSNIGGDMEGMDKNNYYLLRDKERDFKYLVSEQEFFEEPTFDENEEYYDPWEAEGYKTIKYKTEDFLEDRNKKSSPSYKELSHYINQEGDNRYFFFTSKNSEIEKINKTKYNEIIDKVKKENHIRLLEPKELTDIEIKEILMEDLDGEIKVIIDNKLINLNTKALIKNQRTLVPVRSIFEALDIDVEWDGKNQIVTGKKDDIVIKIKINDDQAYINDKKIKLDSPAIINKDNRTLVPLRFIAEAIGGEVNWIGESRTVDIKLNK